MSRLGSMPRNRKHTGGRDEAKARWAWQRTKSVSWTFLWMKSSLKCVTFCCLGIQLHRPNGGKNSGAVISGPSHSRIPVGPLREHPQTNKDISGNRVPLEDTFSLQLDNERLLDSAGGETPQNQMQSVVPDSKSSST